jgi:acyl-coenzyme A thioesterase PaaI-like protein
MQNKDGLEIIEDYIKASLGDKIGQFLIPPPVFVSMQAEVVAFDPEAASLTVRFPVRGQDLNPYRSMQGGMIAAAIDNTLGPLSMLVAPPNVTRTLEVTYSKPITLDLVTFLVTARLVKREKRFLDFSAEVTTEQGLKLARAKAVHWIVNGQSD